jgi:2-methylcitrate dehydratase
MQAGIDALRALAREYQIRPGEVQNITVYTMTHVKEENTYVRPQTPVQALFSYPHVLAIALLDGDVTPSMTQPEMLNRPDVQPLREKVRLVVDPEYDKMWPGARPARVQITTSRGTFEKTVLYSLGTAENPMTWEDQVEKFNLLAIDALGVERAQQIVDKIWTLDQIANIGEFTALLRP